MNLLYKLSLALVLLASCLIACNQRQVETAALPCNDVNQSGEANEGNKTVQVHSLAETPTPALNVHFGKGLRIVPKEFRLENERLRYKIDVVYPRIQGTENPRILNLNRRIERLVSDQYRWPLHPPKEDLRYYDKHPDIFNTVDLTYEVPLATDELLSIYFEVYSYGIGAAHSVQYSFAVNYDLKSGKLLRLADIFKPDANYLGFISHYCTNVLTKRYGESVIGEALAAELKNHQSWNITKEGVTINFDACYVLAFSGGQQEVVIPFTDLKDILNPNNPVISLSGYAHDKSLTPPVQ